MKPSAGYRYLIKAHSLFHPSKWKKRLRHLVDCPRHRSSTLLRFLPIVFAFSIFPIICQFFRQHLFINLNIALFPLCYIMNQMRVQKIIIFYFDFYVKCEYRHFHLSV